MASSSAWRLLNLILPALFAVPIALELCFMHAAAGSWIVALSTLGAIHHLATVPLVMGSRQARGWINLKTGGHSWVATGGLCLLFCALFAAFVLALRNLREYGAFAEAGLFLFVFFDF